MLAEPEDARALQEVRDQYRLARVRLKQLEKKYGPRYPELVAAQTGVVELEALAHQQVHEIVDGWRSLLDVALATELDLEKSIKAEQEAAQEAEASLVQEEFFRGNIARIEELHAATSAQLVRMQSTEEAIAGGRSSIEVRVLDGPVVLDDMTWPKPKLVLPASACLGFVLGFCGVLLRDIPPRLRPSSQHVTGEPSPPINCDGNGAFLQATRQADGGSA
jgi:uncharacterized protein involved in exopolysaccharide biosynthesis